MQIIIFNKIKALFLFILAISLSQTCLGQGNALSSKNPAADLQTLTNNYMTWYTYTYDSIRLCNDFIGLDVDSVKMDRFFFLEKLRIDDVFAFKTGTMQGEDIYKLFPLTTDNESIKATIKEMAETEIRHYKMEGTAMPAFSFTDLNGNNYDNSSTKGKLVVLKCWFIHCVTCVKEFPELNKLIDSYKNNDDILFVSLASDNKDDLVKFLKAKKFKYAVVPEMSGFMNDRLYITAYPTHLLIGRDGKIIKITNRIEDLVPFLGKALTMSMN